MVHRPVHLLYYVLCFFALCRLAVNWPTDPTTTTTNTLNNSARRETTTTTTGPNTILNDATAVVSASGVKAAAIRTEQPHHQPFQTTINKQAKAQVALDHDLADEKKVSSTTVQSDSGKISAAAHPPWKTSSQSRRQLRPYPRWSGGIAVVPLAEAIRFILSTSMKDGTHSVYFVDADARLWRDAAPRSERENGVRRQRGKIMEPLVVTAFRKTLQVVKGGDLRDYPYLKKALLDGGFAYIVSYHDTTFCCDPSRFRGANGKKPASSAKVPIVTLSAPVDCNHSFPVPTYATIGHARKPWAELIVEHQKVYPWSEKKRSAIWRGTATGSRHAERNKRVQLCELATKRPDLVDAKLSGLLKRRDFFLGDFNESQYVGNAIPMADFQKYRAIVDVDGNSWSSRFGELLCYSSVVLKVQPANVDYFHSQLQPWVHFIPIKSDLSDLYEMVELAVSDDNPLILQIIRNANDWCLQQMTMQTLERDMARIWDTYAFQLYQSDPSWNITWQTERESLLKDFNFTVIE